MRHFIDAPTETRCTATITLKDGTTAQCGRHRKVGTLCTQHAKIQEAKLPSLSADVATIIEQMRAFALVSRDKRPADHCRRMSRVADWMERKLVTD